MNSCAPRCSDALSLRSVPACWTGPPAAASAENESSMEAANTATRLMRVMGLVMRGHPIRHRLGLVELRPQRHGDEEGEVEEGQEAADDGFDRVGTRAGADLAQPDEGEREQAEQHLRHQAAV